MPNVSKIVKGVAKAVGKKKAAAANKKGLKAAQGPSKAPKGYKTDAERRKALMDLRSMPGGFNPKRYYVEGAKDVATLQKFKADAPKNVISKSGRKANTPRMMKKAAKKAK
jgi:hypothetical protein